MPRLLPRMALEPPPGYVAFVERHLEPLRRDCGAVVGDEDDADRLYSPVLTDVAARWGWLCWRTRTGQDDAAERYLHRAFARQSQRWLAEQGLQTDIEQDGPGWWVGGPHAGPEPVRMRVLRPGETFWLERGDPAGVASTAGSAGRTRAQTSAALRMAPFLKRDPRSAVTPLAEASVAWWHAYEARRRHRAMLGVSVGLVFVALLLRVPTEVELVLIGLGTRWRRGVLTGFGRSSPRRPSGTVGQPATTVGALVGSGPATGWSTQPAGFLQEPNLGRSWPFAVGPRMPFGRQNRAARPPGAHPKSFHVCCYQNVTWSIRGNVLSRLVYRSAWFIRFSNEGNTAEMLCCHHAQQQHGARAVTGQ